MFGYRDTMYCTKVPCLWLKDVYDTDGFQVKLKSDNRRKTKPAKFSEDQNGQNNQNDQNFVINLYTKPPSEAPDNNTDDQVNQLASHFAN